MSETGATPSRVGDADDLAHASRGAAFDALVAGGLDVVGVLSIARFDVLVPAAWRSNALLPGARSALVIGSGGTALWRAIRASDAPCDLDDPVDRHSERVLVAFVRQLLDAGDRAHFWLPHQQSGSVFADFVALGAASGLGAPSRLGLLVHPVYGPWLSLRALVLTTRAFPETEWAPDFHPCEGCPAPCAAACPGAAVAAALFDAQACGRTRRRLSTCVQRCDARHACLIGREHAYEADAEAHHMRAALAVMAGSRA